MNKPPAASTGMSAGKRSAQEKGSRAGTAPATGRHHRPIQVLMFSDCRHSQARFSHRSAIQPSEIASHYPRQRLPIDRLLITRLFISALQRAGHDVSPEPAGFAVKQGDATGPIVLEGCLWKLRFEARPTPILDLDLSLTLWAPCSPAILWQTDFPEVETLPFWIGMGCRPDEMVPTALAELEAAALGEFRSERFLEAIGSRAVSTPAPAPDPGGSHKVVAATSWTASEQGEITATAHESGTGASVHESSGEDMPSPAAEPRMASDSAKKPVGAR